METTGTLTDGVFQFDDVVDLPNHSRVSVAVKPLADDREEAQAALERFLRRAEEWNFNSGGVRFTRDELHERR